MKTRILYELRFPNGKRYIGLTAQSAARRFAGHLKSARDGSRLRVHQAIRKYQDGVTCHALCIGQADYIAKLEVRAIAAYRTREIRFGYNVAIGGDDSPVLTPGVSEAIKATKRKTVTRRRELAKAAHARPETKERHRAAVTAAHARPEVKARHTAAVRKAAVQPARREAISRAQRERFKSLEARAGARLRGQAQWRDPELCERNLAAIRAGHSRPDARDNHRRAALAMHADPDFKERHREGARRGQRARRQRELAERPE